MLLLLLLHGSHQEQAATPVLPVRDLRQVGGARHGGLPHREGERDRGDALHGKRGRLHNFLL